MDSNNIDPRMMILDADPGRYIRTPSGAVVAIIKAAEGFVAFTVGMKMIGIIKSLFPLCSLTPIEILALFIPKEIMKLVLPDGVSEVFFTRLIMGGNMAVNILGTAAAAAICVILACILIEAPLAILLWLFLTGSQVLSWTRRIIFYAFTVLAVSFAGSILLYLYCYYLGAKGEGAIRLLIVSLVVTLVLALQVSYTRAAASVTRAIAYEFKLGFKETQLDNVSLGRDALLFMLIYGAAAGTLAVSVGWKNASVIALGVLALKQLAVYSSWMDYRRCHM